MPNVHNARDRVTLESGKYWTSHPVLLILPGTGYKHPCYAYFAGPFMVPFGCDCIITTNGTRLSRVTVFNFAEFSMCNNQLWDNLIVKSTVPKLRYELHRTRLEDVGRGNTSWIAGLLNQSRQHLITQRKG